MGVLDGLPTFNPLSGRQETPTTAVSSDPFLFGAQRRQDQPSALGGGLRAGFNTVHGLLAGALATGARSVEADGVADWAEAAMVRNLAEAQQYGRPDLETAPWREDGSPFLPWLVYQAGKQVPIMGGIAGATLATGPGGGIALGSMYGAGSMYESALQADGDVTPAEARRAALMSVPYGVAEAAVPASLSALARPAAGAAARSSVAAAIGGRMANTAKGRVFAGMGGAAAGEAATEAVQTGMELSFRPDMTPAEKSREIVDAALTGGLMGGVFGGVGIGGGESLRYMQERKASQISNDELAAMSDQYTKQGDLLQPADEQVSEPAQEPQIPEPNPRPFVDADASALVAQLTDVERRINESDGGMTQSDAMMRQLIRNELQMREDEVAAGNPLARQSTGDLERALLAAQARAAQKNASEADTQLMAALQAETDRRKAVAPVTAEGGLFGDTLPIQRGGSALAEQAQIDERAAKLRTAARKLAGGKGDKFINGLNVQSDLELAAAVHDHLSTGVDATNSTMKLAEALGVVKNGESVLDRDLAVDMVEAQNAVDQATQKYKATGLAQDRKKLDAAQKALGQAEQTHDMAVRLKQYLMAREQGRMVDNESGQQVAYARTDRSASKPFFEKVSELTDGYDVLLPDDTVATIEYRRRGPQDARGWYMSDGTKIMLRPGEKGAAGAAAAVARQAAEGQLPKAAVTGAGINDKAAPGNRYRMGEQNAGTVTAEEVTTDVETAVANWGGALDVSVVQTAADLPADVAASVMADNATTAAGITTPDGRVYLISDNLTSREEGVATLYHEALGHVGLMKKFRSKLNTTLRRIYQSNETVKAEADLFRTQRPDAYASDADPLARAVEEALAQRSMGGQMRPSWFARLAHVVRDFARRAGFNVKMSDAEVDVILAMAHNAALTDRRPLAGDGNRYSMSGGANPLSPRTVVEMNDAVKNFFAQADKVSIPAKSTLSGLGRKFTLAWGTWGHLTDTYGHLFKVKGEAGPNVLERIQDIREFRTTMINLMDQQNLRPVEKLAQLEKTKPAQAKAIRNLMGASFLRLNPKKTWQEHTWLHEHPQKSKLQKHLAAVRKDYNAAVQNGSVGIYNSLVDMNRAQYMAQYALVLHNTLKAYDANMVTWMEPAEAYQREDAAHRSAAGTRKFWADQLDMLMDQVAKHSKAAQAASAQFTESELKALNVRVETLSDMVKRIKADMKHVDEAPYFHLGRFGNFFVTFPLPLQQDANGVTDYDDTRLEAVREALRKEGFEGIELPNTIMESNHAFVRVDTEAKALQLRAVVERLRQEGVIPAEGAIKSGDRRDAGITLGRDMNTWNDLVRREMEVRRDEAVERAETAEEKERVGKFYGQVINQLHDMALNMLPDIASAKVMTQRESVPGFSTDQVQSYVFRARVGAHALANLATAANLAAEFSVAHSLTAEKQAENTSKSFAMKAVLNELERRERLRPTQPENSWVDHVRAWNHAYFLGMSPAYFLTNLTQIPVLLLPQLGKKHGYSKATAAIFKTTPLATKIVNRAFLGKGDPSRTWKEAVFEPLITPEILKDLGVSDVMANRVMHLVNTGIIDIGAATREMGRIEQNRNQGQDKALRLAGAFGLYTEMVTRLVAALSAYELADQKGPHHLTGVEQERYVSHVVSQSMFNYTADNVGRAAGRHGIAGSLTPIPMAFMQYSFQLIEKLTREAYMGFLGGLDADPQTRVEARRFVAGHMMVVGTLAGSLGLPGASVFARVLEALVETFDDDDEPWDAKAAYRNFLADTFGPEVGEVLARGVLRPLGGDFSTRLGEQDLVPFTRVLTDRREWKDKLEGLTTRFGGSPLSMVSNILEGGTKMANGEYMAGLQAAVPIALKGPLKASKMMSVDAYLDKNGNELPMSPDAWDIFVQFFGITPSEMAEYNEANFAHIQRTGLLRRQAQRIRKNLVTAIEQGDTDAQKTWLARAQKFDVANPAYDIVAGLPALLSRRSKAQMEAQTMGVPYRANLKDFSALRLTGYANY